MFDIGWSEILVIAVVAIVVVGPKELPRMLRAFGKTMGTVRRTANDFKRQFDEALREAERSTGLDDTRKELQAIARDDPLKDAKKNFSATPRTTGQATITPSPSPSAAAQSARVHEAEPAKTGAAAPAHGSDAA